MSCECEIECICEEEYCGCELDTCECTTCGDRQPVADLVEDLYDSDCPCGGNCQCNG